MRHERPASWPAAARPFIERQTRPCPGATKIRHWIAVPSARRLVRARRRRQWVLVIERVNGGRTHCGTLDGHLIISASSQPFLDAARILLAEGHAPNRKLEMWRPGKASWDLRAPLWAGARLDVERGRFVRHREIRPESLAGASNTKSGALHAAPAKRTSEPARAVALVEAGHDYTLPAVSCARP
jgi:hypothetical protein